jgi:hypothetical protein
MHHFALVVVVISVVRTLIAAESEYQRTLTASSGPSGPLYVIGRTGRNIAEMYRIQFTNINAQLHGRGAEECGKAMGFGYVTFMLEGGLVGFPDLVFELAGVFTCPAVFELFWFLRIKVLKEKVWFEIFFILQAQSYPVVIDRFLVAYYPLNPINRQLVERRLAEMFVF